MRIKVDATDDRRPAFIRTANEDGTYGEWKAFVAELDVTLSEGPGVKGIYVQVMDAAGNESEATYKTLLRTA